MKQLRNTKGTLETLLVIGLILVIPLFFALNTRANTPAISNAITSLPPTISGDTFEESNAPLPKQPLACNFPLAQIMAEESAPASYIFSEPQIVLTSSYPIDIVEWLPDNQRVLVTQYIPSANQQSIELFNPQTGERDVYAVRTRIDEPPSWLPESNAVIYPAMNIISIDKVKNRYEFTRQVRLSIGDFENTQLVADNLLHFYIAVKPGRNQIVYLTEKQLTKGNASLETQQSVAFDSTQWEYRRAIFPPPIYKMTWRPGTSQVVLYSNGDTGGYTFLLDTDTGKVCEIDLGNEGDKSGWAEITRWSPDGRYLAIIRSWGTLPINFSDLGILDTVTGNLYTIQIAQGENISRQFVEDIAWAPDNNHLVAIGSIFPFSGDGSSSQGNKQTGLYLIDVVSGQNIHFLPDHEFSAGWPGTNLSWSLDGSQLLVRCPTPEEEKLCLISVQRSDKP